MNLTPPSAGIYLFKINNEAARAIREICSKLTIKTPEQCISGIFIVNFQQISTLSCLCFWLWTSKCQASKSQKLFYFCWENNQKLPENAIVLCYDIDNGDNLVSNKCEHSSYLFFCFYSIFYSIAF